MSAHEARRRAGPVRPAALSLFSPCPRGLEQCLAQELSALGAGAVAPAGGGVAYEGDLALAYRANLQSRIASRVLLQLAMTEYRSEDDLYQLALDTPWETHFGSAQTLRVDLSAARSPLNSLNFATLRVKDGIVDRFREQTGERPSIDTREPDVRVFGFLDDRRARLYLDLSGEPLFKRGWRQRLDKGEAPLKENLAAGLLALCGWQPGQALLDPFCGSGTIVIEAAQIARQVAPGLSRRFGFERLHGHDDALWQDLRAQAMRDMQRSREFATGIIGSDIDPGAIEQARTNARRAGLGDDAIKFSVSDCLALERPPGSPGQIVGNPPYGERIDFDSGDYDETMIAFGQRLKENFRDWSVWILSSDRQLPRHLRMREHRKHPLFNGPIECRLFGFSMVRPAPR